MDINRDERLTRVETGLRDVQEDVSVIKSEFKGFIDMRDQKLEQLSTSIDDVKGGISDVQTDVKALDRRNVKWYIAFLGTVIGTLIGVVGILLKVVLK